MIPFKWNQSVHQEEHRVDPINIVKVSLSIFDWEKNVAFHTNSNDIWTVSIWHEIYHLPAGRVLTDCLLPTITLFERMKPLATPMLVIKSVMKKKRVWWYTFPQQDFLLFEKCCSHDPEWTRETHPLGQTTFSRCPFTYFGAIISNTMFHLTS